MGTQLQLTDDGAATARSEIESLGGEYEASLSYPIVGLVRAPKAQAARDDLKEVWDTRREAELDGVEALAMAISAIAASFDDADGRFNRALNELEIARNNTQGAA